MGRLSTESDYENLRNARISENQARMASLGLQKSVSDLQATISSAKSMKTSVRKYQKVVHGCTPLRRSNRLNGILGHTSVYGCTSLRRSSRLNGISGHRKSEHNTLRFSDRLKGKSGEQLSPLEALRNGKGEEKRPANAPFLSVDASKMRLSPDVLARRCNSKGRGSVYDPVFGICCHYCRQKKLCGEEDCKRCSDMDMDQPCLGKTDCSVCHSTNGVLCRACLKVRYGEEMEDVRENKEWMCPHCIEDKGINPYWICNSSLCLKKRKMVPTGIAIFKAREEGYKSVAHLLMDKLQQAAKLRR